MFSWVTWENPVAIWWIFLVCASVINILFWSWTRVFAFKGHSFLEIKKYWNEPKNLIWFCAFYVFGCAFRSFLPRADVQRITLFDTWWSSIFVGRTVATIAELAFIIQWVIVLKYLGEFTKDKTAQMVAKVIFPAIFIAECFSWYAVIRTHYIGNAVEESLWALTYVLIGIAVFQLSRHFVGALQLAARFSILGCILYVLFMVTVDVPMYVTRLMEDIASGKEYLGLAAGFADLNSRWHVTHDIQEWKTEIPWKTLYFSFAVLVSISLCYVPLQKERLQKYLKIK